VQKATIVGGETIAIIGKYELPDEEEEPWYETVAKYAVIGGAVVLGVVLVVPRIIEAAKKK
jgi:hypothetical protein